MMTEKTALQSALAKANQDKFETDEVGFGKSELFKVKVEDLTDEQIVVLFRYGKRKFNDMWNGSHEKKDGKNIQTYWTTWLESMVEGRTRGEGTTQQTTEERAWIRYYGMTGIKIGGRVVSGKTLHTAQLQDCKKALVTRDPSLRDSVNLDEQAEALLPAWIAEQEQNMEGYGAILMVQKALDQQKTMA